MSVGRKTQPLSANWRIKTARVFNAGRWGKRNRKGLQRFRQTILRPQAAGRVSLSRILALHAAVTGESCRYLTAGFACYSSAARLFGYFTASDLE